MSIRTATIIVLSFVSFIGLSILTAPPHVPENDTTCDGLTTTVECFAAREQQRRINARIEREVESGILDRVDAAAQDMDGPPISP